MKKFLSIIKSEFKNFLSDEGIKLVMIVGVLAYMFCYALPYYKEVIKEVPVAVVDLDQSDYSRSFIRSLDATDSLQIKEQLFSLEGSEEELYRDKIKGFIVIPKDFEKDTLQGKQTNVSLYADSAYLIVYKTVYSAVLQTSIETGAKIEVAKMMKKSMPKKQAIAIKQPFEFVQVPLFNSIGGYKSYVYPVILILILHQTLVLGMGLVQGTRNEIKEKYCKDEKDIPVTLLARSTMYILLYLIYGFMAFLIFPSIFVYPMNYNIIPLFVMYLLMLYAAAFFAQTISYWFKIRESAILVLIVFSIIFIFIPGLIWPRESIPQLINIISFFIPATCGIDGIIKINQNGAGFMNVIYDYLWLMFLCVFYFCTAVFLTKRADKKFD